MEGTKAAAGQSEDAQGEMADGRGKTAVQVMAAAMQKIHVGTLRQTMRVAAEMPCHRAGPLLPGSVHCWCCCWWCWRSGQKKQGREKREGRGAQSEDLAVGDEGSVGEAVVCSQRGSGRHHGRNADQQREWRRQRVLWMCVLLARWGAAWVHSQTKHETEMG